MTNANVVFYASLVTLTNVVVSERKNKRRGGVDPSDNAIG